MPREEARHSSCALLVLYAAGMVAAFSLIASGFDWWLS